MVSNQCVVGLSGSVGLLELRRRGVAEVAVEEGADPHNVRLRTVQDASWPFPPDAAAAPLPVVAVDLAESPNARERRLGAELLARL